MARGYSAEVQVFGEDVIRRRFLRFAERAIDARSAFRSVARILEQAAERQFNSEGAFGGQRWADLAASTLARKQRLGMPSKILQATGALKDSLTGHGAGHIERIGRDFMEWGSSVAYGGFHMRGTARMPARPPLKLPEPTKRQVVKTLQRAIVEG